MFFSSCFCCYFAFCSTSARRSTPSLFFHSHNTATASVIPCRSTIPIESVEDSWIREIVLVCCPVLHSIDSRAAETEQGDVHIFHQGIAYDEKSPAWKFTRSKTIIVTTNLYEAKRLSSSPVIFAAVHLSPSYLFRMLSKKESTWKKSISQCLGCQKKRFSRSPC